MIIERDIMNSSRVPINQIQYMITKILLKFKTKFGVSRDGQFDSTNIKNILNTCSLFTGWKDSPGWLQVSHCTKPVTIYM